MGIGERSERDREIVDLLREIDRDVRRVVVAVWVLVVVTVGMWLATLAASWGFVQGLGATRARGVF